MSLSSHVQELKKKHQHLSDSVEGLQRAPGSNDLEISAMKKKKLALKQEIAKLNAH